MLPVEPDGRYVVQHWRADRGMWEPVTIPLPLTDAQYHLAQFSGQPQIDYRIVDLWLEIELPRALE